MAYFGCGRKALLYKGLSEVLFHFRRYFESLCELYKKELEKRLKFILLYKGNAIYDGVYFIMVNKLKRYIVSNRGIKNDENSCSPRFI